MPAVPALRQEIAAVSLWPAWAGEVVQLSSEFYPYYHTQAIILQRKSIVYLTSYHVNTHAP